MAPHCSQGNCRSCGEETLTPPRARSSCSVRSPPRARPASAQAAPGHRRRHRGEQGVPSRRPRRRAPAGHALGPDQGRAGQGAARRLRAQLVERERPGGLAVDRDVVGRPGRHRRRRRAARRLGRPRAPRARLLAHAHAHHHADACAGRTRIAGRGTHRLGRLELGVLGQVADHAHRGAPVHRLLDLGRQRDVLDQDRGQLQPVVGELGRDPARARTCPADRNWRRGRAPGCPSPRRSCRSGRR